MPTAAGDARGMAFCVLAFDANNRLAVRRTSGALAAPFCADSAKGAEALLAAAFPAHSAPAQMYTAGSAERNVAVSLSLVEGAPGDPSIEFRSIERLESTPDLLDPELAAIFAGLLPHLVEIPYLGIGEADFIYKFRPERERNAAVYSQDEGAASIYQSRLCAAIKELARRHERTATAPVHLDFGPVRYVVPSHFGFCLGVKNAIERAYETLAENPGRRVFMLSELIHNPFVNEDLIRRGLRYLQTDKGAAFASSPDGPPLWDTLTPADIVIVPAFGATDEDKRRLVRKGIAIRQHDATCMLVERVWKAARAYGREGYTVVIHGKHEHEETKATFSNTRRHAPAVIVRNLEETRELGEIILQDGPAAEERFRSQFAGKYTEGFSVERDLRHVAVVNQTTLLMNETREIIEYLRGVFAKRFGPDAAGTTARVGGHGRNDTLCYATQVNQDALSKALAEPLDAAFVVGGKNSSNTYQLHRLCEERLGERAYFIQSEANILSSREVEHFVFPGHGHGGQTERRRLWEDRELSSGRPMQVLVTGGASCPDGIIQQVITRINGFFPAGSLRGIEEVLVGLAEA